MGYREYRREKKQAQIAEMVKASMANLPAGATVATSILPNNPVPTGPYGQFPAMAEALMRNGANFGAPMGPGVPLIPVPLDKPENGDPRASFRRYQYDISHNLNINERQALWNKLRQVAVGNDLTARCIQLRTADVLRMDLTWGVSADAISTIMQKDNLSASEAGKVARKIYMPEIDRMKEFCENPFPEDNRTYEEFMGEVMWQLLVYDGLAIAPAFNLGAECIGFEIIDAPTINILLNNYGRRPLPPAPAFQQNLWGYVRGEAVGNSMKGKTFQDGAAPYDVTQADVLSYFILNPRTNTPYGWSPVERSLPLADLYSERLKWLLGEYKWGTSAKLYWRTTDEQITLQNLATSERILNEGLQGMTDARYQTKIMPPGFEDPFEVKNVDELYKADYDEHILKQYSSFFNLAPSQLGVIARAGMGGGKGAAEGQQDMAESVSTKPQNRQLEGIWNSLVRQHLGCDKNVVASLNDDEGSENQLEQANAFKIFIDNAVMRPNEAREELGLTPDPSPEADQLAYVTATGPVYLPGLLAAQATAQEQAANPPEPKAPIIMQGAPDEASSGQESQEEKDDGQEEVPDKGVTAKVGLELEQFAKFVATQHKRRKWRNFEFEALAPEQAEKLNTKAYFMAKGLVQLPENFGQWASETAGLAPLGKSRKPHKAQAKLRAIANNHVPKISTALKLTGIAAAVAGAVNHAKDMGHLLDESSATDIATTYAKQTGIDQKALQLRLVSLYQEVGKEAQDQFAQQTSQAVGSVDLAGLLQNADITIKGINDTAQSRVVTAVKDGLLNGKSTSEIAQDIQSQVEGPMRLNQADLIARTETTRAYSQVFGDQLAEAGMNTWDWVCEGGNPCQACIDQEGTKDITDTNYPPLHPNCECACEAST